jgi:hypothetical protein
MLEPDTFDINDRTVDAVERGLDRLYYRIHKKRFDKMRIEEQLGEIPKTPREFNVPPEDDPYHGSHLWI